MTTINRPSDMSQARSSAVATAGKAHRFAVNLLLIILAIMCFDGTVRKYLTPSLGQPLVLLRDPFILAFYIHCIANGMVRASRMYAGIGLVTAFAIVAVVVQISQGYQFVQLIPFGIRQYLFILPLPVIMSSVLTRADVLRIIRAILWILVLMTPLVMAQALTPSNSWFNVGRSLDEGQVFRQLGYGNFARASGFFTSSAAYTVFVALGAALVCAVVVGGARRFGVTRPQLWAAGVAVALATGLSGSRALIVSVMIVGVALVALLFAQRRPEPRTVLGVGAVAVMTVSTLIALQMFFPQHVGAIAERWAGADMVHERQTGSNIGRLAIFARAFGDLFSFINLIPDAPLFGYGIGLGTNAGSILASARYSLPYAESDFSRHIVDLGPLAGVIYIIFRLWLTTWLGWRSLAAIRLHNDPLPLLLYSVVGVQLLTGQISGNSTIGGLTWFGAGLLMALLRSDGNMRMPHAAHR